MSDSKRLLALDGIRGLAAIGVVLFHYTSSYNWPVYHPFYYCRYLEEAVQVFFIISGFFILLSLKRIRHSRDFIIARFARLYPVYLISLISTLLITNITNLASYRTKEVSDILLNFSMFQEFFDAKNVNIVYWTLTIEIAFYCMMLIVYKLKSIKYIDWICGVWLGLLLLDTAKGWNLAGIPSEATTLIASNSSIIISDSGSISTHLMAAIPTHTSLLSGLKEFIKQDIILLRGRASLFISGILLYQIQNWGFSWYRVIAIILCIAVEAFDYSADTPRYAFLFFTAFIVIIFISIFKNIPILSNRRLVFLGSISYSLYLMHLQVQWATKSLLQSLPPELTIALQVVLALILSYWLTKTVEIPVMREIRLRYRQRFG